MKEVDPLDYRARVKDLRKRLRLTQVQFADALGVSFATVNRWENCHCVPSRLTYKSIVLLCKEAGITDEGYRSQS
jgi:putative transcriptional regulator